MPSSYLPSSTSPTTLGEFLPLPRSEKEHLSPSPPSSLRSARPSSVRSVISGSESAYQCLAPDQGSPREKDLEAHLGKRGEYQCYELYRRDYRWDMPFDEYPEEETATEPPSPSRVRTRASGYHPLCGTKQEGGEEGEHSTAPTEESLGDSLDILSILEFDLQAAYSLSVQAAVAASLCAALLYAHQTPSLEPSTTPPSAALGTAVSVQMIIPRVTPMGRLLATKSLYRKSQSGPATTIEESPSGVREVNLALNVPSTLLKIGVSRRRIPHSDCRNPTLVPNLVLPGNAAEAVPKLNVITIAATPVELFPELKVSIPAKTSNTPSSMSPLRPSLFGSNRFLKVKSQLSVSGEHGLQNSNTNPSNGLTPSEAQPTLAEVQIDVPKWNGDSSVNTWDKPTERTECLTSALPVTETERSDNIIETPMVPLEDTPSESSDHSDNPEFSHLLLNHSAEQPDLDVVTADDATGVSPSSKSNKQKKRAASPSHEVRKQKLLASKRVTNSHADSPAIATYSRVGGKPFPGQYRDRSLSSSHRSTSYNKTDRTLSLTMVRPNGELEPLQVANFDTTASHKIKVHREICKPPKRPIKLSLTGQTSLLLQASTKPMHNRPDSRACESGGNALKLPKGFVADNQRSDLEWEIPYTPQVRLYLEGENAPTFELLRRTGFVPREGHASVCTDFQFVKPTSRVWTTRIFRNQSIYVPTDREGHPAIEEPMYTTTHELVEKGIMKNSVLPELPLAILSHPQKGKNTSHNLPTLSNNKSSSRACAVKGSPYVLPLMGIRRSASTTSSSSTCRTEIGPDNRRIDPVSPNLRAISADDRTGESSPWAC